jgi:hypothetical protein
MECFGGGIRHTLSRKCIEDDHYGAADHYAEIDKHKGACPKCGCEEVNSRNLWTCECPACQHDWEPTDVFGDNGVVSTCSKCKAKDYWNPPR